MDWLKKGLGLQHPDEEALDAIRKEIAALQSKQTVLRAELDLLENTISSRRQELIIVDDIALLQSFALYEPSHKLASSTEYKSKLESIRSNQKKMIKHIETTSKNTSWTVNGNRSDGRRMIQDVTKLLLRAFNLECDSLVDNVRFNNLSTYKQRMQKTFDAINQYGRVISISIPTAYFELKIQELELSYECDIKKQSEKEEAARKRELLREEQKVLREIEAMKQKIEKEETHFKQAIAAASEKLNKTTDDAEKESLLSKIAELESKLLALEKDKQNVFNREQNTRAGYVYVISNIGAFGENIYKIGVSRRLEPRDRVRELGMASVPFGFDIHTLIFSEDAPALEYELHKTFENRRLNKVNPRKEFFNVTLEEIAEVVKKYHDKQVEFIEVPEAEQYRIGLKMSYAVPAEKDIDSLESLDEST